MSLDSTQDVRKIINSLGLILDDDCLVAAKADAIYQDYRTHLIYYSNVSTFGDVVTDEIKNYERSDKTKTLKEFLEAQLTKYVRVQNHKNGFTRSTLLN